MSHTVEKRVTGGRCEWPGGVRALSMRTAPPVPPRSIRASSHPAVPHVLHTPDPDVPSPGAESCLRFQYNLGSDRKKYNLIMYEVKQLIPGNPLSFKPRHHPIKYAAARAVRKAGGLPDGVTGDSKSLK